MQLDHLDYFGHFPFGFGTAGKNSQGGGYPPPHGKTRVKYVLLKKNQKHDSIIAWHDDFFFGHFFSFVTKFVI